MGDKGNEEEEEAGRVSLLLYSLALDYDCRLTNRVVVVRSSPSPSLPCLRLRCYLSKFSGGISGRMDWVGPGRIGGSACPSVTCARSGEADEPDIFRDGSRVSLLFSAVDFCALFVYYNLFIFLLQFFIIRSLVAPPAARPNVPSRPRRVHGTPAPPAVTHGTARVTRGAGDRRNAVVGRQPRGADGRRRGC